MIWLCLMLYGCLLKESLMSKKHEYVAEVLHHEEEELVSIIMDY